VHYPVPVHLQAAYADRGYELGSLPVTEACANQVLSLPMFAELTTTQIDAVVHAIGTFLGRESATMSVAPPVSSVAGAA
jgi:dTDP-4-amino-4,6-dideoxygalactose transaminase